MKAADRVWINRGARHDNARTKAGVIEQAAQPSGRSTEGLASRLIFHLAQHGKHRPRGNIGGEQQQ